MRPSGDNSIYQRPPVQQQMAPPSNQVVPQIQPQIQPTIQNKQQQFVIHSQQQAVIHPQGLQQQLMVRPTVQQLPQQPGVDILQKSPKMLSEVYILPKPNFNNFQN